MRGGLAFDKSIIYSE